MPPPIQRNSILISIKNRDGSSRPDIKCNQEIQTLSTLISNLKSIQGKLNDVLTEMVDKDNETTGGRSKGVHDSYGDEEQEDGDDDDSINDESNSASKTNSETPVNRSKKKRLKTS